MVKNLPANAGDIKEADSIPRAIRSPGGGHDNLLQYSCLENPMDRGAWQATVYRVAKSQTSLKQLSMHTRYYKPSSYLLTTKKKKKSSLVVFFQPMIRLPSCSYILSQSLHPGPSYYMTQLVTVPTGSQYTTSSCFLKAVTNPQLFINLSTGVR